MRQSLYILQGIMLIPGAEPFPWELSIFLKSLKEKFSDTKDLEICGAGGRWFKGGQLITSFTLSFSHKL